MVLTHLDLAIAAPERQHQLAAGIRATMMSGPAAPGGASECARN
jgi:hypothetical protein